MTTPHDAEAGESRTDAGPPEPVSEQATRGDQTAQPPPATAEPRTSPPPPGPGWASSPQSPGEGAPTTTVLPAGGSSAPPLPHRPATGSPRPPAAARPAAARTRRARLTLRRLDPWSVFVFSLVAAVFLGIAMVIAVAALYAVLGSLGVTGSLNSVFAEVTGGDAVADPLLTGGRIIGGAAVLAAVNIVLLTLLATLGALLYNVCASFTGGLELVFGERD